MGRNSKKISNCFVGAPLGHRARRYKGTTSVDDRQHSANTESRLCKHKAVKTNEPNDLGHLLYTVVSRAAALYTCLKLMYSNFSVFKYN